MRKAAIVGIAVFLLVVVGCGPVAAAVDGGSQIHASVAGDCPTATASIPSAMLQGTVTTATVDVPGGGISGSTELFGLGGDAAGGLPTLPVLIAGYSRHEGSDPLDNDRRARVFEVVGDAPGIAVTAVAERADVSRSTARYHTRVLEEEGLVFGEKIRGKLRYFPADDDTPELTAALADEASATVLFAVARRGPASVSALAEAVDRAPSTVSHHLSRLDDAGLVERDRDGGSVLTRLAPGVAEALAGAPPDLAAPPVGAHADD